MFVHRDTCGPGRSGGKGIYVMRADGTQRKLLIRQEVREGVPGRDYWLLSPSWSPDGRRLAFVRGAEEGQAIFVTSATPKAGHRQFNKVPFSDLPDDSGVIQKISWGPARMIAFDSDGGLHLVHPDAGGKRRLTGGIAPEWSPQASSIAFNRSRVVCTEDLRRAREARTERPRARTADAPCEDGEEHMASIYVVHRNGRGLRRLLGANGTWGNDWTDEKETPVWSPDGRRLAFIWNYGERADLYVIPARGGRKRRLATDVGQRTDGLSWQALRP